MRATRFQNQVDDASILIFMGTCAYIPIHVEQKLQFDHGKVLFKVLQSGIQMVFDFLAFGWHFFGPKCLPGECRRVRRWNPRCSNVQNEPDARKQLSKKKTTLDLISAFDLFSALDLMNTLDYIGCYLVHSTCRRQVSWNSTVATRTRDRVLRSPMH